MSVAKMVEEKSRKTNKLSVHFGATDKNVVENGVSFLLSALNGTLQPFAFHQWVRVCDRSFSSLTNEITHMNISCTLLLTTQLPSRCWYEHRIFRIFFFLFIIFNFKSDFYRYQCNRNILHFSPIEYSFTLIICRTLDAFHILCFESFSQSPNSAIFGWFSSFLLNSLEIFLFFFALA